MRTRFTRFFRGSLALLALMPMLVSASTLTTQMSVPPTDSSSIDGIPVSWGPALGSEAVGFDLQYRISPDGVWKDCLTKTKETQVSYPTGCAAFKTPALVSDTMYYFRTRGYDVNGQGGNFPLAGNINISLATNQQDFARIVADGAGGFYVTWRDLRAGNSDIYAQHVNNLGAPLWTADGQAIASGSYDEANPELMSDGAGGVIVTWADTRNGQSWLYAQRLNASGVAQWTAGGVMISVAHASGQKLLLDASNNVFVVWNEYNQIKAQKLNLSGAVQWAVGGKTVSYNGQTTGDLSLLSDGSGGLFVLYENPAGTSGSGDIRVQRLNASGDQQFGYDGKPVAVQPNNQFGPHAISDGSTGMIITWEDQRNAAGYSDVYAQRLDSNGNPLWAVNGVAVASGSNHQTLPSLVTDGAGGALISYGQEIAGNGVYLARVSSAGTVSWTTTLTSVMSYWPQLTSDGTGGAIVTWSQYVAAPDNQDIYAQRVNGSGVIQWTAGGKVVASDAKAEYSPRLVSDGSSGAYLVWELLPTGPGSNDLIAQRINASGNSYFTDPFTYFKETVKPCFRRPCKVLSPVKTTTLR